ncbi:MAG: bifunctional N-acetylglucosamine-1-phosphate uridyltransferase/glucosamine-1-phosphate acetyltransferase, partial [Deltaproteobacteria bacterium]|nr:bifunctional N-acetylglucosamine-1-phosphate uridyltransferase/glucosamine-1-phosphate acetyltransferase [Deltaproteobacteria bacterium]
MFEITTVILAAGEGTRMRSALPKPLHPICGRPMIDYPLRAARLAGAKKVLVVAPSKGKDPVARHLKIFNNVEVVEQKKPRGTGDAVRSCRRQLNGGSILILCGDNPLIRPETLQAFLKRVRENDATLGFITTRLSDPAGYGRVVRDRSGEVVRIVEEKECSPQQKNIREINSGIYCVKADWLLPVLEKLKPHPVKQEYYLTDIIEQAIGEKKKLVGFFSEAAEEFLGVNTQEHLSIANRAMRERLVKLWMERGVSFLDHAQVYLYSDVQIGAGSVIYPQVYLRGKTR